MAATDGFSKDGLLNQAQNVWSMLDEMAATNPESYKRFIDKQLKEGKESIAPPQPHMCVQTTATGSPNKRMFINFCSWHRIPQPPTDNDPISVIGSPLDKGTDEAGSYMLVNVAFSTKILEELGRDAQNRDDRKALITLAFEYLEHQHPKLQISRSYTILERSLPHKGSLEKLESTFLKNNKKIDSEFEDNLNELGKSFGPISDMSRDEGSLMSRLANICVDSDQSENHVRKNGDHSGIKLLSEVAPSNSGLIEDITDKLPTPAFHLSDDDGHMTLNIQLPGVTLVSECELDISTEEVTLAVADKYELLLRFPKPVNDSGVRAKFFKKTETLIVTAPLL